MRLRVFLAIVLAVWAAHTALDFRVISAWTERAIMREADTHAQAWTQYAIEQLAAIEEIAVRGRVAPEDYHLIDTLVQYSDVFRFKIYGPNGEVRLVSDENMAQSESLFSSRSILDLLSGAVVPVTVIKGGDASAFLPETYSQTIVPIVRDARLIGMAEVFVDQTARIAAVRTEYQAFGRMAWALGTFVIACFALWMGIVLRDHRRANEALRREQLHALASKQASGDFIKTVNHELRNPLHVILGVVQVLRGSDLTPEDRHLVDIIEDNAAAQRALIDDLLAGAETEAHALKLEKVPCALHDFMQKTTGSAAVMAANKGLRFSLCLEAPDVVIDTDPQRLRQIVANLMSNAIKFTEEGSVTVRVQLGIGEYGVIGRLRVLVADSGIGIDEACYTRAFERFERLEAGARVAPGGKGLGLAISRAIAREMQGDITVSSEPGKGTVFTLDLPVTFRARTETCLPTAETLSELPEAPVAALGAVVPQARQHGT